MTMTIVNIDPKIQILLLIIFISHESQGRHNLQLFKGTKNLGIWHFAILTHRLNLICKSTWWSKHIFFQLYVFYSNKTTTICFRTLFGNWCIPYKTISFLEFKFQTFNFQGILNEVPSYICLTLMLCSITSYTITFLEIIAMLLISTIS
jgi:hypothetical protein